MNYVAIRLYNPQGVSVTWVTWFGHALSKVIEQIPIGVAVTLPHGAIEYASRHLRQWLGLSVERALGANLAQFRSGSDVFPELIVREMLLAGESWQDPRESDGKNPCLHSWQADCRKADTFTFAGLRTPPESLDPRGVL